MTKAERLKVMKDYGFNIPRFVSLNDKELVNWGKFKVPFDAREYIVRSSFSSEDSKNTFAGVYNSYGPIKRSEIPECLNKIVTDANLSAQYLDKHGIEAISSPGAIVQEYIRFDKGGVCVTDYNRNILIETGKSPTDVTAGKNVDDRYLISRNLLRTNNDG